MNHNLDWVTGKIFYPLITIYDDLQDPVTKDNSTITEYFI